MSRRAFTLVELLVVVAVIGLLVAVLLPALSSARSSAQRVQNLSNLRQLVLGTELYVHDHEHYFAHKLPSGEIHRPSGRPGARWQWSVGEYVGRPYFPQDEQERKTMLSSNDFPRLDNQVFRDPLHDYEDMRSLQTGNVQVLRNNSYGYNYQYLGNSRTGLDGDIARWPVRHVHVRKPSLTIAFADSDGSQIVRTTDGFREHAYTLDPPRLDPDVTNYDAWGHSTGQVVASIRHGRVTTAFLDGSARGLTLREMGYDVVDAQQGLVRQDAGSNALWNGAGHDPDATIDP